MAYMQNVPRPNAVHQFVLKDFSGGLNNRTENIQERESANMINMRYDERTGFTKRFGTKAFDDFTVDTSLEFVDEYKPYRDSPMSVRCSRWTLYINNQLIRSVSGVIQGVNFQGMYFFTDGTGLYVYGKFPQEGGTYERIMGTPSNDYRVMKVANPSASYTPLDTEHMQGVTVYDYAANRIMYEPCELEMQDTHKGTNVVPSDLRYVVTHKNRLFCSGMAEDDDNIFITDVMNPFYFPVYMPVQVPPNSDRIRGMVVYDDSVIVGRYYDLFSLTGGTNRTDAAEDPFVLRKLNAHCGFANHRSMNVAHNFLFFVGSDNNCYALSSANQAQRILATTMLNEQVDFGKKPINKRNSDVLDARTYFHKDDWYVTIGDVVVVYNYEARSWALYRGMDATCFFHKEDILLFGKDNGVLATFSDDFLDFGEPFLALWESKTFDMGDPISYKHFRDLYLLLHVFPDFVSDIRMKVIIDYVEHNIEFDIRSQVSRFGISKWGDLYLTSDVMPSQRIPLNRRGRFIKFRIMNSYDVQKEVFAETDLSGVPNRRIGETLAKTTSENKYYVFTREGWKEKELWEINQPLKFYEISGDYEFRMKR